MPKMMTKMGSLFTAGLLAVTFGLAGCQNVGQDDGELNLSIDNIKALSPKLQARQAERLYDDAWTMIGTEYVDATFNHQQWDYWRTRFRGKLKDPDDAYVAVSTMVASLNDEYTRFLPPRDMTEQTMSIDSRLYGVGIQISMRDGKLFVLTTIDDTPAQKAGLLSDDLIVQIDGHETAGMSVEDAADKIRGEKGTTVALTIMRGKKQFISRIKRAEIRLKSVFTRPLSNAPEIGYIRLSSFISESMMGEMTNIMGKLAKKKALIIDLRGNYGGLFSNAVEIADMFLDKGKIVSIVNRDHKEIVRNSHPGVLFARPVVVLIDSGSASASEILAGALKDNHRAILIGSQSFGKGLVQKINSLPMGAGLNITISKYLTPNGTDINKKGIAPNIRIPFTESDLRKRHDPQLEKAIQTLRHQYSG